MILKAHSFWNSNSFDLELITSTQLSALSKGTVLYSILGEIVVVGISLISDDARGGFLSCGTPVGKKAEYLGEIVPEHNPDKIPCIVVGESHEWDTLNFCFECGIPRIQCKLVPIT